MEHTIKLYHGTISYFRKNPLSNFIYPKNINISMGRKKLDFGQGFYLTPDKSTALYWAKGRKPNGGKRGYENTQLMRNDFKEDITEFYEELMMPENIWIFPSCGLSPIKENVRFMCPPKSLLYPLIEPIVFEYTLVKEELNKLKFKTFQDTDKWKEFIYEHRTNSKKHEFDVVCGDISNVGGWFYKYKYRNKKKATQIKPLKNEPLQYSFHTEKACSLLKFNNIIIREDGRHQSPREFLSELTVTTLCEYYEYDSAHAKTLVKNTFDNLYFKDIFYKTHHEWAHYIYLMDRTKKSY